MPQLDCYLCEADVVEIAEKLFEQRATIIPSLDYATPQPLVVLTLGKLREILHDVNVSLLFVLSPHWQRSPLQLASITKGGRKVFYVCQKEGGPTLDIFYPQPREVHGSLAIPAGFISYHEEFWNPSAQRMEPAPKQLIKAYRDVRMHIMSGAREIVRTRRRLFATKNTMASSLKLIDLKRHVREEPRFVELAESSP